MLVFIIWAIIFLFTALKVSQTIRDEDFISSYFWVAGVCSLASDFLSKDFVAVLYVASMSLVAYILYKRGVTSIFHEGGEE